MNRKNAVRPLEAVDAPKEPPEDRKTPNPDPKPAVYDVLVVGGGPAGLAAAVVMAVGRRPNTAMFRDIDLSLDESGQVRTDLWQRTNVPGILAVGDVSSHLKMIVTAVAQAAIAAHQACVDIRNPYGK